MQSYDSFLIKQYHDRDKVSPKSRFRAPMFLPPFFFIEKPWLILKNTLSLHQAG